MTLLLALSPARLGVDSAANIDCMDLCGPLSPLSSQPLAEEELRAQLGNSLGI